MNSRKPPLPLATGLSWAGLGIFFLSIGKAATLYPGGNRFDPHATHYSFFGNFLCDLFDAVAYNGGKNPGRPYAIIGTYSLAIGLLFFWLRLPNLFAEHGKHRVYTKVLGVGAMLISLLIATPLHDWCIIAATPLGLSAIIVSIIALAKSGEITLARLGLVSLVVCALNYLSFVFQVFPRTLPGIQKTALISFLFWVLAAGLRLRAQGTRDPSELTRGPEPSGTPI